MRFGGYLTEKKHFEKACLRKKKSAANNSADLTSASPIRKTLPTSKFLNRPAYFFEGAEFLPKDGCRGNLWGNEKNQARSL